MIIFLGDSFTWGQGLYAKKWIREGKSIEYCNNHLPPLFHHEHISYSDDEYRRKYHFPNLVAKHFDRSYFSRSSNGGSNNDIAEVAHNIHNYCRLEAIDLVVIQFTEFTRSLEYNYKLNDNITDFDKFIETECKRQIELVYNKLKKFKIQNILMFSWREDIGKILKNQYFENYVPLIYNNTEYDCFETIIKNISEFTLLGELDIKDGHLSELGHKVIADSIIKKIDSMNISFTRPN